jgi:uncharacterized membrane protein YgdD (TMEM256/DUF423 family)
MDGKAIQRWAGVMGATGVGMGAFGAHALKVRPTCASHAQSTQRRKDNFLSPPNALPWL